MARPSPALAEVLESAARFLGELGDIEAGVRRMIRRRRLETAAVVLASGRTLRVPTLEEIVRIKAYLIKGSAHDT